MTHTAEFFQRSDVKDFWTHAPAKHRLLSDKAALLLEYFSVNEHTSLAEIEKLLNTPDINETFLELKAVVQDWKASRPRH